jgi:hypothetical protein
MAVRTIQSASPPRERERPTRILPVRAQTAVGLLFLVALIAFEIFNFDTTRYALSDFLGDAGFAGLRWATILAIAFGAIDFAGLVRFFLPEEEDGRVPVEVWYLMGAWLLGATMNALMTWWAVNLTLLNHDFGNEVLSRAQLLEIVPIFVALLVWLTRIFFIGAFTVAGGYMFDFGSVRPAQALQKSTADRQKERKGQAVRPLFLRPLRRGTKSSEFEPVTEEIPVFLRRRAQEGGHDSLAGESGSEEMTADTARNGVSVDATARVNEEAQR